MIPLVTGARLSQAVYSPPFTWQIGDVCANLVTLNDEGVTKRALVIQGTRDVMEVLRDVEALPTVYPGVGGMHSGVLGAALALFPLAAQAAPDAVYGHSLGGGVAIGVAGLLCAYAKPPSQLGAFEPLMVSVDDDLSVALEVVTEKVYTIFGNDPIPRLPLKTDRFPYRHPASMTLKSIGSDKFVPIEAHGIAGVISALST